MRRRRIEKWEEAKSGCCQSYRPSMVQNRAGSGLAVCFVHVYMLSMRNSGGRCALHYLKRRRGLDGDTQTEDTGQANDQVVYRVLHVNRPVAVYGRILRTNARNVVRRSSALSVSTSSWPNVFM